MPPGKAGPGPAAGRARSFGPIGAMRPGSRNARVSPYRATGRLEEKALYQPEGGLEEDLRPGLAVGPVYHGHLARQHGGFRLGPEAVLARVGAFGVPRRPLRAF